MERRTQVANFGEGVFEIYIKRCGFFVCAHLFKIFENGESFFEIQSVCTFKHMSLTGVKTYPVTGLAFSKKRLKQYILDYMTTNY